MIGAQRPTQLRQKLFSYQKREFPIVESAGSNEHLSTLLDADLPEYVLRSDDRGSLFDSIATELLATRPMKRLNSIGFLGAIDYFRKGNGRAAHRRRHNRLEHSVGVALLAQRFALTAEIPHHDRLTLIAASLLHDVGHGPLSHTLEPVFDEVFGINHHNATASIIKGDSIFGSEVLDVVKNHNLDLEEIVALIEGKHSGSYGHLFSGKINFDTLEGITRCRAIVGPRPAFGTALSMVERWAQAGTETLPQSDFDEFWKLKHNVYSLLINSPMGLTMDAVAQAWAKENISEIEPQTFHMNERQLRDKHLKLFQLIKSAAHDRKQLRSELPTKWLNASVQVRQRIYYVDDTIDLASISDMKQRYQYKKQSWTVSLEEVLDMVIS